MGETGEKERKGRIQKVLTDKNVPRERDSRVCRGYRVTSNPRRVHDAARLLTVYRVLFLLVRLPLCLKATYAENVHIVLSCPDSKAFIFKNLLRVLTCLSSGLLWSAKVGQLALSGLTSAEVLLLCAGGRTAEHALGSVGL